MRAHDDEAPGAGGRYVSTRCGGSPPTPAAAGGFEPRARAGRTARRVWSASAALTGALMAYTVLACSAVACSELTAPPEHRRTVTDPPAEAPPAPVAPSTLAVADTAPSLPQPTDQIEASHILVSYQGATRAKPTVTRTRDEARELAAQLAARVREPGADFARLAKDVSDGPSGVEGGVLPRFGRQQMVKPFSDAAFALRPGEVSDVVETNFGFHVIKRIQ
jgi:parvulin-like peptidyl-prolyl cis-trans isomerase-like protein